MESKWVLFFIQKKRENKKLNDENTCGFFSEYCENTSIHGMKYIGGRQSPFYEKIWWSIAFLLSIYGCGRLILNIWNKWDQSPVIVSFAEKYTPVWEIPFPAVTICPEIKTNKNVFNFSSAYLTALDSTETMSKDE